MSRRRHGYDPRVRVDNPYGHPLTWAAVVGGVLLAGVMTFAYVGAFVNPIGELSGLRIGYVDNDRPVEVAGTTVAVGDQVVDELSSTGPDGPVEWVRYDSRDALVTALRSDDLAGGLVLPEQLSQQVADIGTSSGSADRAQIEVISNPGAGSLQPVAVDNATGRVVDQLNDRVSEMLTSTLSDLDATISPSAVGSLARPIDVRAIEIPQVGNLGGRGLPPLYVAVMTTLAGLVGAIAVHVAVGALAGQEHVEILGRRMRFARIETSPVRRFVDEAVLVAVLAVASGFVIPFVAVGLLDAQADRVWVAVPVLMLGVASIGWFTLLCVTAFGVLGEVLVVLVTTIFGVPSARGVYPAEALPGFFVALGWVLPLRYLTDSVRSTFFFDARADAGLATGVLALVLWALGSVVLGVAVAAVVERRRGSGAGAVPADG